MKHLLTSLMLLCGLLASAQDNYLVATVDGTDVTYPIDSPADFESANHSTSNSVGDYSFASNETNVTVARANVKSVTLEIPLTRACTENESEEEETEKEEEEEEEIEDETYFCGYLFYGCSSLTEANITFSGGDECTSVGTYFCAYMFYNCSALVSLSDSFTLPQGITSIGTYFCAYMFHGCSALGTLPDEFTLPQGITSIGTYFCAYMFYGCKGLVSLPDNFNIPQGITSVSAWFCYNMFSGCSGLVSLPDTFNLPQGITNVGSYFCQNMFSSCSKLSTGETVELTFPYEATDVFKNTNISPTTASASDTYKLKGNSEVYYTVKYYDQEENLIKIVHIEIPEEGETVTIGEFAVDGTTLVEDPENYAFRYWTYGEDGKRAYETDEITDNIELYPHITEIEKADGETTYEYDLTQEYFYAEDHDCFDYDEDGNIVLTVGSEAYVVIETCDGMTNSYYYKDDAEIQEITLNDDCVSKVTIYNVADLTPFTFTSNGMIYTITGGKNVEITAVEESVTEFEISTEVENEEGITFTVTDIADGIFKGLEGLEVSVDANVLENIEIGAIADGIVGTLTVPEESRWAYYNSDWAKYFTIDGTISFTTEDGFTYTLTKYGETNVAISAYNGTSGDIEILTEVEADNGEKYSVVSIADNAFEDATTITSVKVNWVTPIEISDKTFSGIENATLTVPANSEWAYYISDWASYFTIDGEISFTVGDFTYTIIKQGAFDVELTKYSGSDTAIEITQTLTKDEKEYTVKSIADDAFKGLEGLEVSVDANVLENIEIGAIADGIVGILTVPEESRWAYYKSDWAKYFTIDGDISFTTEDGFTYTLTKYGETNVAISAYNGAGGDITIGLTVTADNDVTYTIVSINEGVFTYANLSSVTVSWDAPATVSPVGAFTEGSSVTLIVPEGSERVYAQSTWANYFTIDGYIEGTTFEAYGLTYEITDQYENEVKIVAFECSESVEIPVTVNDYTVTEIAEDVFANCSTLKYVTIDATEPPCEASLFAKVSEDAVLYVTNIEAYATAGWHDYFTIYGYVEAGDKFVVDYIKYEIINITDEYNVQIIGTTATEETIEFVTEVDFNTFTFDVLNIADNAFDGQTVLNAEINIIDPEVIELEEIAKKTVGTLTVYPGTVKMYEASDWAKYFDIAGDTCYYYGGVYYVFQIEGRNKATSSKNTITLEVDHVDESATEVTIPRTIDLGDDSSTTYDVTSMNADALKDCKDLVTINLEASIPAEDIEALNKVPDSVTIVLDEDELGTEYCESVKAAATMVGIEVKMTNTAIVEVKIASDKVEVERYNLLGQKVSAPQRGINIVKYSDGTVEKVLVK